MAVAFMRLRVALILPAIAATLGRAPAQEVAAPAVERSPARLNCFSTAQTRAEIEARRLVDPLSCMRDSALREQGEPLGARLCRHGEVFVYEINLLRPDGRIVKLMVDAKSGRPHSAQTGK